MAAAGSPVGEAVTLRFFVINPVSGLERMFDGSRLSDLDEILPDLWIGGHPKQVAEFKYVFCLVGKCAYPVASHHHLV